MTTATTPTTPTTPAGAAESLLPGVNILLMGPAGTGKTYSLGTLVDSGLEVFYVAMEPGLESLLAYYTDRGLSIPANLHWHTVASPKTSLLDFIDSAKKANTMSADTLAKMVDPNRGRHNQFVTLLEALNNFTDDRTKQTFGSVIDWGTDKVLIIDGMAGISRAAMSMTIGGKPVKSQADWGNAQGQVEKIIHMLTDHCKCHFVLLSHVERETDAILGGTKLMVSTLGKALVAKLPPMFSDVILTEREGSKFSWNTGSSMADVKTRNLPIQAGLPPDFKAIIAKWKSRGGAV